MDWSSIAGVAVGGVLTIAGQLFLDIRTGPKDRRRRGDQAALDARDVLYALNEWFDRRIFGAEDRIIPIQNSPDYQRLLRTFRGHVALIPDRAVRDKLDYVATDLGWLSYQKGSDAETSGCHVAQYGLEVLGKYLRSDRLGRDPQWVQERRASVEVEFERAISSIEEEPEKLDDSKGF